MSAQSALLHHVGQQTLHARVRTRCAFHVAHRSKLLTYKRTLRLRDVAGCSKRSVKAAAEPAGIFLLLPMFAFEFAGTVC